MTGHVGGETRSPAARGDDTGDDTGWGRGRPRCAMFTCPTPGVLPTGSAGTGCSGRSSAPAVAPVGGCQPTYQ